jgi:hypothetical protein
MLTGLELEATDMLLSKQKLPPHWHSPNSIAACNINVLKINATDFPLIGLYLIMAFY